MRTVADPLILAGLSARLERLTPRQLRVWGTMSTHQMVAHLANTAEAALKRRPFAAAARRPRRVLKLVCLYLPVPWPRNIRTGEEPASERLAPDGFEADHRRAINTLGELASASEGALVDRHPIFGPMSPAEWHRWAFLHVDHHLRQFGL